MPKILDKEREAKWREAAQVKRVEWAYPSSPNATQFKKPRGCYVVKVGNAALSAHDTECEAVEAANALPNQWCTLHIALGRPIKIERT